MTDVGTLSMELVAISAELGLSAQAQDSSADASDNSRSLRYRVALHYSNHVRLSTGEDFRKLEGKVFLRPSDGSPFTEESPFGRLCYLEAYDGEFDSSPASYSVELRLPRQQFEELLSAARLGRVPSYISVDVKGMKIGWEPDGSGLEWDNKTSPILTATSAEFVVPMAIPARTEDDFDGSQAEDVLPLTRSDMNRLPEQFERFVQELRLSVKYASYWMVGAVVLLAILVIHFLK